MNTGYALCYFHITILPLCKYNEAYGTNPNALLFKKDTNPVHLLQR